MSIRARFRPLIEKALAEVQDESIETKIQHAVKACPVNHGSYQFTIWCDELCIVLGLHGPRAGTGGFRSQQPRRPFVVGGRHACA